MQRLTAPIIRRLEGVPLTWRLIAILLTLLLAALTTTSAATAYLLQRDLVQNIDDQLQLAAESVATSEHAYQRTDRPILSEGSSACEGPSNYYVSYMPADPDRNAYPCNPTGVELRPEVPRLSPDDPRVLSGRPFTVGSGGGDMEWRFVAGRTENVPGTFAVGIPMQGVHTTVQRLAIIATAIGLVAVTASGVLGWFATRRAFRPLRRIEDTAAAIAAGDLGRRVPVRHSNDEVASLSDSINAMLGQIERSFRFQEASEVRMRQFVADASHELRTPLATVRGYAELYRQGAASEPEQVPQVMGRIEGEASRMSGLVEDLLMLARLDDERPLEITDLDLVVLCADAVHDARVRAPQRRIQLVGLDGELAAVPLRGDDGRLRQVLSNLLGNALMHTAEDVPIDVATGVVEGRAVVEIRDHGTGIDPAIAGRVFERFYRADKARSRARGGSGLGLAIVAAVVDQHDGRVAVAPTEGGGATFRVELPGVTAEQPRA